VKRIVAVVSLGLLLLPLPALPQTDPGLRGGLINAGSPLNSVAANNPPGILTFFTAAQDAFDDVETVPQGLGPRFNGLSCASCHSQPAMGGSSPSTNPEIAAATANGATNARSGYEPVAVPSSW